MRTLGSADAARVGEHWTCSGSAVAQRDVWASKPRVSAAKVGVLGWGEMKRDEMAGRRRVQRGLAVAGLQLWVSSVKNRKTVQRSRESGRAGWVVNGPIRFSLCVREWVSEVSRADLIALSSGRKWRTQWDTMEMRCWERAPLQCGGAGPGRDRVYLGLSRRSMRPKKPHGADDVDSGHVRVEMIS